MSFNWIWNMLHDCPTHFNRGAKINRRYLRHSPVGKNEQESRIVLYVPLAPSVSDRFQLLELWRSLWVEQKHCQHRHKADFGDGKKD